MTTLLNFNRDLPSISPAYSSKKCPHCYEYLPLEAKTCEFCHKKVGKITSYGMAQKPFDWKAYLLCLLSWAVFILYVKWMLL